ncbi:S8 family serine peptidase [Acaryochloris sp. IP29b_bin.137]|uniref:S8 family serine peptidase n=1 Tax=Acaryochloris sp. IP29b_bin.137 TaxID=2969217 RepID=UPI00261428D6|nr:S8 family serine peptidase [Acaryochloris sp. IP29b_bin.137]
MSAKYLVTIQTDEDGQLLNGIGCVQLAKYPTSFLVACDDQQQAALEQSNLDITPLEAPTVKVTGTSFTTSLAVEANNIEPITFNANRQGHYLLEFVGPVKGEWLSAIEEQNGNVHCSLSNFTLLIGMAPDLISQLQEQPWVESITPYRPTMKVSPQLRTGVDSHLNVPSLTNLELEEDTSEDQKTVEVELFPGENASVIADQIRSSGGIVFRQTATTVTASVPPRVIAQVAKDQGVEAILPFSFPQLSNDKASEIMGVPSNHDFGNQVLRGANQIVAVADSGLDTGNSATVHADFQGRIVDIASWPLSDDPFLARFYNTSPGNDDGPSDRNSGHGTHVAGSVLGNGAAAEGVPGSTAIPRGIAPEAQLYFQSVEQVVDWKSEAQLSAEGLAVPFRPWPPNSATLQGLPEDLNNLFEVAYTAGARIHTNSWGANNAGVYNASSQQVDNFMWNHRDILILFSAGNAGVDRNGDGIVDQDSIGTPATGKNCLTVGASENRRPSSSTPSPGINARWQDLRNSSSITMAGHVSDNVDGMAAFSSRGPTDDGRIKPDVVAPGTNVLSARSSLVPGPTISNPGGPLWGDLEPTEPLHNLYCWSGGTSMSTPLVAGAAAIIRQHLVEERSHSEDGVKPSGALLKAFLINGAKPMSGQFPGEIPSGPNSVSGFGRVNLTQSLIPGSLQKTLFVDEPDQAVETGEIRTYSLQPVDASQPVKITLVWTDAPSLPGTGDLQNQLYLQVLEPTGTVLNGDITPFPEASNNVQQVIISTPDAATYIVRVRGISVIRQSPGASDGSVPRQDFAIAASNVSSLSVI